MILDIAYSTIAFRNEKLIDALDTFAELGFDNIELHLHHFFVNGEDTNILKNYNFKIVMLDGGWSNFFSRQRGREWTFDNAEKQVALAKELGCNKIRTFFGILKREDWKEWREDIAVENISTLADRYHDMEFFFENHSPGVSNSPVVIKNILKKVNRSNIRAVFDPQNFIEDGFDPFSAVHMLSPFIGHMHLKTNFRPEYFLSCLEIPKYTGYIGIEYERQKGNHYMEMFDAGQRVRRMLR